MAGQKLTVGDIGDEVSRLHEDLKRSGFEVSPEEVKRKFFGPATRAAVAECQRCNQVEVTGHVDTATAAILAGAAGGAPPVAAAPPITRVPPVSVSPTPAPPPARGEDATGAEGGPYSVEGRIYSEYGMPAAAVTVRVYAR